MPSAENAPCSEVTYKIIGAALTVFHKIGPGHEEAVYQAMLREGNPQISQMTQILVVAQDLEVGTCRAPRGRN